MSTHTKESPRRRSRSSKQPKSTACSASHAKPRSRGKASRRRAEPRPRTSTRRAHSSSSSRRRPPRLRRIIERSTYLVTKKTNDDLFWLKPTEGVNLVLLYTLLLKAEKYGLWLHAFCFMSNHFHLVVTDPRGELPAFMREFLGESGKALKVELKTTRRIWSGERYHSTELLDVDAAERLTVYTLLNPLEAGLTEPSDWPGLTGVRYSFGSTISAARPDLFFSKRYRPDEVSAVLEPLPQEIVSSVGEREPSSKEAPHTRNSRRSGECQKRISARLKAGAKKIRARQAERGTRLSGPERVLATRRDTRGSRSFGRMIPRFASQNQTILQLAIESSREFEKKHELARIHYADGVKGALFPRGTYGYRRVLNVRVARAGSGGRAA